MITDVPGVRVGHWDDPDALTGCTVVLCPPGARGSVIVAGGAPATRATDALAPATLTQEVHAVVLTGGSAFGLATVDGVMAHLEAAGIGFDTGVARVPIVPGAAIFDLGVGDPRVRPGPAEGQAAAHAASAEERREGSVGAGMGATVGKWAGLEGRMRGGLGGASRGDDGLVVGALVVCNALGDVLDERGEVLAGSRTPGPARPVADFRSGVVAPPSTTIACVASNAALTKEAARRVAQVAATGLARAIRPVHTMLDGDAVFAVGTGERSVPVDAVGILAADALAEAVRRAVRGARGVKGTPAVADRGAEGMPAAADRGPDAGG